MTILAWVSGVNVHSLDGIGLRLYKSHFGTANIADRAFVRSELENAAKATPNHKVALPFLWAEWDQVVDAWQLDTWESYRDVARLGRKTRLSEAQRRILWTIFSTVKAELNTQTLVTFAEVFTKLANRLSNGKPSPFDYVVVDEAQDGHRQTLSFAGRADCLSRCIR